ncbi:hypothetical protein [Clostridium sp.]|uniref:hypothetical protein n=1 Tax=Clostridium sp. TaxID=1506 RepID=UPI002FC88796
MRDKINIGYVKKINSYIDKLELNKIKLQKEKNDAQSLLEERMKVFGELVEKKDELESKYEEILKFIINKGVFFQINNSTCKLNQWDNLILISEKNNGILKDKKDQVIKIIDKTYMKMVKDILDKGFTISFIAIRANETTALIQGRFVKK